MMPLSFASSQPARALLASAFLLLGACASTPPVAQRYVPPPVGATVEYQVTNTGSFGSGSGPMVLKVSEVTWEGRKLRKYESPAGATLQDPLTAGTVAVLDASNRPLMRYEPALDFRFPMAVGNSWTAEHVLTVGAATKMPMKTSWKVEAYEKITVPAGTFDAYRIVMTDNFGYRLTNWSVPEKMGMFAKRISERPAGHPQGQGTQVMEMTKVPAVR